MSRARRTRHALGAALALALSGAACTKRPDAGWVEPPKDGTVITCPVTGDRCAKTPSTPAAIVHDRTYYFCSDDAAARFRAAPERYASP
ncbi:hypothetical protein L6R52_25325 [Myxococcota bacterium]|nr:hypothetical protein [Myxococcota bacterium]